jgi:hypothetical protein
MDKYIRNLPYFHVGGKRRNEPIFRAIIIKMIIEEFGLNYVTSIFNFYRNYLQKNDIINQPTIGELTYEKLSGQPLFTNMGYKNLEFLL